MPTARPSSVATFIANTEMSRNWASTQIMPSVTVTAMPPPITGRAAATRVPKMSTRTMMAIGKVYVSAVLRSSAEICSMSAYTAGSPVTGDPAVYADIEQISAEDLRTAETYTLPIAIIVLVLIFGTLVAAALPVIGGGMAVTVTLGMIWVLAQFLDISVFAMNVATLLGLAVGIDYSLFMVWPA